MNDFYQLSTMTLQGQPYEFSDLKNKVVLIVNTASECGFTKQYEGLQTLHKKYAELGLVVLAFPCNQFGKQEPGNADEIAKGCLINYGVDFTVMNKVDVNGEHAHAIFRHLKSHIKRQLRWPV